MTAPLQNEEVWLRGPLDGVPPLLMPAAHALVQVGEDARRTLARLDREQLWQRPGGAASVGYHLRHLAGSLDRLYTYARGEALSSEQRQRVAEEGRGTGLAPEAVRAEVEAAIARALEQIRDTPEATLLEPRAVGRKALPSTVVGLLFHGAEHAARHAGQAITTALVITGQERP